MDWIWEHTFQSTVGFANRWIARCLVPREHTSIGWFDRTVLTGTTMPADDHEQNSTRGARSLFVVGWFGVCKEYLQI